MPQVPRRDNQAQRLQDKEAKRARGSVQPVVSLVMIF